MNGFVDCDMAFVMNGAQIFLVQHQYFSSEQHSKISFYRKYNKSNIAEIIGFYVSRRYFAFDRGFV